ncbi:MAG: sensor domain-containing diguanylate cyclase, partial [Acidobacteria bacterium]|nr:sensor domain-containing diguanylate cyclase [Acidobacteriota bacterium]
FIHADSYRLATDRAVAGDWLHLEPQRLFENALVTASKDTIEKAAAKVASAIRAKALGEPASREAAARGEKTIGSTTLAKSAIEEAGGASAGVSNKSQVTETAAWRSFFGSLLRSDQQRAVEAILAFIAKHYGLADLIWLDRIDGRLENTAAFGRMKDRKVRLGISSDDPRLAEALREGRPLELSERRDNEVDATRSMHLFPVAVDGQIIAAIAVLGPIDREEVKKQISRIGRSVAPQLEILRLRREVERRETLSNAVRSVAQSLRDIDEGNFWLSLTQTSAELIGAERSSLLIYDGPSDMLQIRAIIGARGTIDPNEEPGVRVSRIVFGRNEPAVIADVTRTGLEPAPPERKYKTNSFLSCPITLSGRHLGVMNFTDRASAEPFDEASLELFQAIEPQLAVAIDRALLKERAGQFEQLSVTDPLTGLLNRRYIEERLMEEVKRSNRHGFPMSFMMLDVDHFKSYNDEFGHPAGDVALKMVGHVIRETLRAADVAARFGGEEFSILLPQTTAEEAAMIAERIRHNVEYADFPHRKVTITIGVASCSAELCSSPNIISAADKALYDAKRSGRNRVKLYEESLSQVNR